MPLGTALLGKNTSKNDKGKVKNQLFHNIYNFFFLTLQTRAIAQLSYGSKVKLEKLALIVQWIERRFPKPLIRVRFPVGVLNITSYPLPCKREESDYHFI